MFCCFLPWFVFWVGCVLWVVCCLLLLLCVVCGCFCCGCCLFCLFWWLLLCFLWWWLRSGCWCCLLLVAVGASLMPRYGRWRAKQIQDLRHIRSNFYALSQAEFWSLPSGLIVCVTQIIGCLCSPQDCAIGQWLEAASRHFLLLEDFSRSVELDRILNSLRHRLIVISSKFQVSCVFI